MNLDELIAKLRSIEAGLMKEYPALAKDQEKHILTYSAKVSEEYGELMNEVLASLKLQRQDKLAQYDRKNLISEFADVIGTVLLLGLALDIDLKQTLINLIETKYQKYATEK